MSNILMTADAHLGVQNRLRDIMWALRTMREYARRHDIDTILGLGDLLHDRSSIDIEVLCACSDFFTETRQKYGQRWVWLLGNHDMYLKHSWSINGLKPLAGQIDVIDDVKMLLLDGRRFWMLPFIHLETSYMKVLQRIEELYEDGDVLCTHTGVMGAIKNTCFLLRDWSVVHFASSKFTAVYTGHFHSHQQVGHNVWYPGSPIPFKRDEGDCAHGFFDYDIDTGTHQFIDIWDVGRTYFPDEVPPPNFMTVTDDLVSELTGAMVVGQIVTVAGGELTQQQELDLAKHLTDLGAAKVSFMAVSIKEQDTNKAQTVMADLFGTWLNSDGAALTGLDKQLLCSLNSEIVKIGDERYSSTLLDT